MPREPLRSSPRKSHSSKCPQHLTYSPTPYQSAGPKTPSCRPPAPFAAFARQALVLHHLISTCTPFGKTCQLTLLLRHSVQIHLGQASPNGRGDGSLVRPDMGASKVERANRPTRLVPQRAPRVPNRGRLHRRQEIVRAGCHRHAGAVRERVILVVLAHAAIGLHPAVAAILRLVGKALDARVGTLPHLMAKGRRRKWRLWWHIRLVLCREAGEDGAGFGGRIHGLHVVHFVRFILRIVGIRLLQGFLDATTSGEFVARGIVVPPLEGDAARVEAFIVKGNNLFVALFPNDNPSVAPGKVVLVPERVHG